MRHRAGAIAVQFAVVAPILLVAIGSSLDYVRFTSQHQLMQRAADAAALGAAKELSMSDTRRDDIDEIANAIANAYIRGHDKSASTVGFSVSAEAIGSPLEVHVELTKSFTGAFSKAFSFGGGIVAVKSVARIIGKPNICVLGLNSSESGTISLEQDARLTGENCAVYSNSASEAGIKAKNSASLTATFICSGGGRQGNQANYNPEPFVDCPYFEDPLSARPEPLAGDCDPSTPTLITSHIELDPGTYCGLVIAAGGKVTLRDGIFIFKDKPLVVEDHAEIHSEGAGLFFTGSDAYLRFEPLSTIAMQAPKVGDMAGLLVFSSRSQDSNTVHEILSDDARTLLGTIYIPKGELRIDATQPIADQSAYTAIVAEKVRLYGGPHLVLNTNYHDTDVPVPPGIRGVGQPVVLTQ